MARTRSILFGVIVAAIFLSLTPADNAVAKGRKDGYIYGKVETRSGNTYTGLIRWGTEEAFWDDLFHSSKEKLPYMKYLEEQEEKGSEDARAEIRRLEREEKKLRKKEEKLRRRLDKADIPEEITDLRESLVDLEEERADLMEQRAEAYARSSRSRQRSRSVVSILGGSIRVNWDDRGGGSRIFIARFGDIKKIDVIGSEDAEVTMKNGKKYIVSGYSNDVGGKIEVRDNSLGDIKLPWKKIETIEFLPTPGDVKPEGYRLRGTLVTDGGEYNGYIQWDSEECLSTDKLDGDSEDGRVSIPMGAIRSLKRRSMNSTWVQLKDGRKMSLEGTNDVDASIRGIMIEDPRYGRVKVSWDAFEELTFEDEGDSGPGYDTYRPAKPLQGVVTDVNENTYEGRIVFDLDESESWEMLNGNRFDIEYNIPFSRVASISPRSRNSSMVVLTNGEKLRLEGGQDVSDSNDGILVFPEDNEDKRVYIPWEEVEKIDFRW
ncbi:MAG TPA: hypothetical protein ENI92_05780 [Bacteroidetes bacterium]|nr:hypothetical protein [Bacteroidota bacterium]